MNFLAEFPKDLYQRRAELLARRDGRWHALPGKTGRKVARVDRKTGREGEADCPQDGRKVARTARRRRETPEQYVQIAAAYDKCAADHCPNEYVLQRVVGLPDVSHSGKAARRQKILEAKRTNRCLLNSTKTQEAI